MAKRISLSLSDDTHAQVKARAADAGVSAHAWIVAAVEREAYRQLLEKQAAWNAAHPEEVAAAREAYQRRHGARVERKDGGDSPDSSAA